MKSAASATPALRPPRASTFDRSDWQILAGVWQPLAYLDELSAEDVMVRKVLDVDLACWRAAPGADAPVVAALDYFPRAGGRLGGASLVNGVLTDARDGMRYAAADGANLDDPAAPGLLLVRQQIVHGILWICLTGAPARELPAWPELADTINFKQMRLEPLEWACNISRQVENFMDVAHLSWLHTGTFGNRERPEVPAYQLHELPAGAGYRFDVRYPRKSVEAHAADAGAGQVEDITLDYDLHLPFCTRLVIRFPDGTCYRIYNFPAAVSRKRCRIFIRMARDFDLAGSADSSIDLQMRVLAEDQPMVEGQRPEEIPLDLTEEFHIAADRLSAAYRKALRAMGLGHPLSS